MRDVGTPERPAMLFTDAAEFRTGRTALHNVFEEQPSCRARPCTDAFSRRICPIAHSVARRVNNPRVGATCGFCSMTEVTGQNRSGHLKRRFRHHNLTGEAKHGASISSTVCRPCPWATTPQDGQPTTTGRPDSTCTRSPSSVRSTPVTCSPTRPTRTSQRWQ